MSTRLGANYVKLWIASVISNLGDGVSIVAYPWLASAVTRNPVHIAAVTVITRLPWLLFSLPAGVITDRVDRRKLAAWMDVLRFVITLGVAFVVLAAQPELASPDEIATGNAAIPDSGGLLLIMVYVAAGLLGTAEVFRDNSAQTLLPSVVDKPHLEKANGRLWGAEMVMNSFVGPPLGGFLLAVAFSLPFFLDAGSFAVAAALVFMITGRFRPQEDDDAPARSFWGELRFGVSWLWKHRLFRPMAISLGILNAASMMWLGTFVLFAQEVLGLNATEFGLLSSGIAIGGVISSFAAHRIIGRVGQAGALILAVIGIMISSAVSGLTSSFWVFWAMGGVGAGLGVLWNVVTVSLRQNLIPDRVLGRVNSVYRFIGWGMMPIGSFIGGVLVASLEPSLGREWALRSPFLADAAITLALLAFVATRLSKTRIEEAKAEAEPAPEVSV